VELNGEAARLADPGGAVRAVACEVSDADQVAALRDAGRNPRPRVVASDR